MSLVKIETAAKPAERLLQILDEIGTPAAPGGGVDAGLFSLREILRELATLEDAVSDGVPDRHIAAAGTHDLAAKVCAVWDRLPREQETIKPHLHLLATTKYVTLNAFNPRREGNVEHGDADKVIELYWGCLCLLAGFKVKLDDPIASSGGKNPDVLATASDGTVWGFAIKTMSEANRRDNYPKNLRDLIKKGLTQIENSEAHKGFVVVNIKNVLIHEMLRDQGPYRNLDEAISRVRGQLDPVFAPFYKEEVFEIAEHLKGNARLAPLFAVVAHSAVLAYPPGSMRNVWTELRIMFGNFLPTPDEPSPGSFGAEAFGLADELNHIIQTVI
jgi:hypothetical protein